MRLVYLEAEASWVVQHGGKTVAIGGTTFFSSRDLAVEEIAKRGLVVLEDGTITREPEEALAEASEDAQDQQEPEVQQTAPEDAQEASTRRRGRPRTYTPEEAKERRRAQNREYYRRRTEARQAEVRERAKAWQETHPDKIREYRQSANEKRRERYRTDPDYRAKVDASNRAYQQRKRAEKA